MHSKPDQSTRRTLLLAAAAWPALASTRTVFGQSRQQSVVIGWFDPGAREANLHFLTAFREGLALYGWKEGTQYVIEERWLENRRDRLHQLAQELAARKPNVIVAQSSSLVVAAAKAAPGTPIVQMGGSPLETGIVTNLARPGGMITGLSSMAVDLSEKLVEFLRESVPKAQRVGFLIVPKGMANAAIMDTARRAITRYSIDARFGEVSTSDELDPVISRLAKDGMQAIVVLPSAWFSGERHRIVKRALMHQLPLVAGGGGFAEAGALLSYSAESVALRRRAAYYVDRILKGAKPGDLPIEQPTRFELVLNMKTAKALGITFPPTILVRADKVIE